MDGSKASIDRLTTLAAALGDEALFARAAELRSLAEDGKAEVVSADAALIEKISAAWAAVYRSGGAAVPAEVQQDLLSLRSAVGFSSFKQALASTLQNLRPTNETYPAFGAALEVLKDDPEYSQIAYELIAASESGFIPEGAARAGLQFVSDPVNLIAPMLAAGIAGRVSTAAVSRAGGFLGLADEAIASLGTAFGLTAESVVFSSAATGSYPEDIPASAFFFGGLRIFNQGARFAASLLQTTETGLAIASLTGHAASIAGLASMEGIQEAAGIAPANSGSIYERLVRAAFLHATVQSAIGVIDINGVESRYKEVLEKAQAWTEALSLPAAAAVAVASAEGGRAEGSDSPPNIFLSRSGKKRVGSGPVGPAGRRRARAQAQEELPEEKAARWLEGLFKTRRWQKIRSFFWDPPELSGSAFKKAAEDGPARIGKFSHVMHERGKPITDLVIAALRPFIRDEWRDLERPMIIELGAGSGELARAVTAETGAKVLEVDLAYGAQDSDMRLIADMVKLKERGITDGQFKIVLSSYALEYEGLPAFKEAARILAPGGKLVALVHHRGSLLVAGRDIWSRTIVFFSHDVYRFCAGVWPLRLLVQRGWLKGWKTAALLHLHQQKAAFKSQRDVEIMLTQAGFTDIKITTANAPMILFKKEAPNSFKPDIGWLITATKSAR